MRQASMDAPSNTPGEGERSDGDTVHETLRCPVCSHRWVHSYGDLRAIVECPECGERQWVCSGRLCEIGDGGGWTEIVELTPPREVVVLVEALQEVSSADAAEVMSAAVTLDLVFEWDRDE